MQKPGSRPNLIPPAPEVTLSLKNTLKGMKFVHGTLNENQKDPLDGFHKEEDKGRLGPIEFEGIF